MQTRYDLRITGLCPVDGSADAYDLTLEAGGEVRVEAILDAVREVTREPATQEAITLDLRRRLPGRVTTVGWHSGVRVEVVVE